MMLPFKQRMVSENSFFRTFSSDSSEEELYWHKDKRDRIVRVLESSGWMFQQENSLPIKLSSGDVFSIKKETWHRVIRGDGPLEVYIEEVV